MYSGTMGCGKRKSSSVTFLIRRPTKMTRKMKKNVCKIPLCNRPIFLNPTPFSPISKYFQSTSLNYHRQKTLYETPRIRCCTQCPGPARHPERPTRAALGPANPTKDSWERGAEEGATGAYKGAARGDWGSIIRPLTPADGRISASGNRRTYRRTSRTVTGGSEI